MNQIKYNLLPSIFGEGKRASYKGVIATIYEYKGYALIYTIESQNEGKGEVREFIQLLRKDYPVIKSSVPLNDKWAAICKNYNIEIVE